MQKAFDSPYCDNWFTYYKNVNMGIHTNNNLKRYKYNVSQVDRYHTAISKLLMEMTHILWERGERRGNREKAYEIPWDPKFTSEL